MARYGPAVSRILLVRHARSVPPALDGPDDYARPLSPLGLEQATRLAADVARRAPRRILCSPYLRARQTVEPAAAILGLPVEDRHELREWDSGLAPKDDWEADYRYAWDNPDHVHGDGESHRQLEHRATTALASIAADAAALTVVSSHGAWIARALRGLGQPVDADFWLHMPMPALYDVVLRPGVPASVSGPGLREPG